MIQVKSLDSLPDGALVGRKEISRYLSISSTRFDTWVLRGFAPKKVTPNGIYPKWTVKSIRDLKTTAFAAGVLPIRKEGEVYDIADPSVPDTACATKEECSKFLGIGVDTWDRLVAKGKAPKKCSPDGFFPKWNIGEVRKFFSSK